MIQNSTGKTQGGTSPAAAAYVRFVIIASVISTALVVVPIVTVALMHPGREVLSPPLIAWIALVYGVQTILTIPRIRRLKNERSQKP